MRLLEKILPQTPEVAVTDANFSGIRPESLEAAKAPNIAEIVHNLPERILADDPRVAQLVVELSGVDSRPAVAPTSLEAVNNMIQTRLTRRHMIETYRGEWPNVEAIPNSDIPCQLIYLLRLL